MSTFYVDLYNGDDTANGDLVTLTGCGITAGSATASVSSTAGLATGWKVFAVAMAGATRDTAKIASGVTISSLPNATAVVMSATAASTDANIKLIFSGAWKTWTSGATAARVAPGDTIKFIATPSPTSIGNATWTDNSTTLTLATAQTANIDTCDAAWTGGDANVTLSTTATRKEGTNAATFAFAAGFTTGLAAYKTISSTDYSGYQQLSLWMKSTVAFAASDFSIQLCSDTAGVTAVNTFNLPACTATGVWQAVVVDLATNLGSAIQSVAIYAATDIGAFTLTLDNLIACKSSGAQGSAGSLTLGSVIGKNTATEPEWHCIAAINGTTVTLGGHPDLAFASYRAYRGTTETVATYIRNPLLLTAVAVNADNSTTKEDGSNTSRVAYSGGWSQIDMQSQDSDGETWWAFPSVNGFGIVSLSFIDYSRFGLLYGQALFRQTNSGKQSITIDKCYGIGSNSSFYGGSQSTPIIKITNSQCIRLNGSCETNGGNARSYTNCYIEYSSSGAGIVPSTDSGDTVFKNCVFKNNTTASFSHTNSGASGARYSFYACNFLGSALTTTMSNGGGTPVLTSFTACTSTDTAFSTFNGLADTNIISVNENGTVNNHVIRGLGYTTTTETGTMKYSTNSALVWKIAPTSANRNSLFPIKQQIAAIACASGSLVTASVYAWRSSTATTGMLVCPSYQLAGIGSSDITTSTSLGTVSIVSSTNATPIVVTATAHGYSDGDIIGIQGHTTNTNANGTWVVTNKTADTFELYDRSGVARAGNGVGGATGVISKWEKLTITFTPTEVGVAEIYFYTWGGTTNSVFIDDMEIYQA